MKGYKRFILMVVLSFLVIVTSNPLVTYAASSSNDNKFVFYLPMGVIAAGILAAIVNAVQKITGHKE